MEADFAEIGNSDVGDATATFGERGHPLTIGKGAGERPTYHEQRFVTTPFDEDDQLDEVQFTTWVKQASQLPGERM